MGYNTKFSLYLRDPSTPDLRVEHSAIPAPVRTAVIQALSDAYGFDLSGYWISSEYLGEWKWYSAKDNLRTASADPKIHHILELHGVGEEYPDEWVAYAYRGRLQVHTRGGWTPPSPDPAELGAFQAVPPPPIPRIFALRAALAEMAHAESCPLVGHPSDVLELFGGLPLQCTCVCRTIADMVREMSSAK